MRLLLFGHVFVFAHKTEFRRHVEGRSDHVREVEQRFPRFALPREAEINDFHISVRVEENVVGFQVSVNDLGLRVRVRG